MFQTRNAIGNLLKRYRAVLAKNRLMNVFGTLAVGTVLVGTAGLAQAVPGSQDEWNLLFKNGPVLTEGKVASNLFTHAEGRDHQELLTILSDWKIEQASTVNGKVSLGNPHEPKFRFGNVLVQNNSVLTVTGSLSALGGLTLGEEASDIPGDFVVKNGTLILDGVHKESASLDISGAVTVGRNGGANADLLVPGSTGGDGALQLNTGIANFRDSLTVGGSSGHVTIPGIDYEIVAQGKGGDGILTVGKDAELHMQAGSTIKFGGDASSGYNDPITGNPVSGGSAGGKATVTSDGFMRLGNMTMGGNGGKGANSHLQLSSAAMSGGAGGEATLNLNKGSVTVMDSLNTGGSLTITDTSGYLVTNTASKVSLNGGTLSVGGNIGLNGNKAVLIGSNLGGKNHNVTFSAGAANHLVTQGTVFAGDAPVNIENGSSLSANMLDTTTKVDGTHVAGGQNVTVSEAGSSLYLTQNVNQGTALNLGAEGNLFIKNGTLGLTGNVALGNLGMNDKNYGTVESLTGVQKGNGSIIFALNSTLAVDGVLSYAGNLKVFKYGVGNDIFGADIKASGISTSSLTLDGSGNVQLVGFTNAGQNFLSGNVNVSGDGVLTLGGVEGRGGSSTATIALNDNGKLALGAGNFSTGTITVNGDTSSLNIGNHEAIGNQASLQANVNVEHGGIVVNNASDDGSYTIKGTVTVKNDARITMDKGTLNIDGVLDYLTSNDLLIDGQSLVVKTLNLVGQNVHTGIGGKLTVADLNSSGAATIDTTGGTLDLGAQNIADLSKMGAGTAGGAVEGYEGYFTINDSVVKTTGTGNYTNDTALTLYKQTTASTATAFNGALEAGKLVAKTLAGVAQDVNVFKDSLTLYGTGTEFLDVNKLVVSGTDASVQLGSKDYALGGSSASKVELAGGSMKVKGGMFTFTEGQALNSTSSANAGNVNIDDDGVLAFTKQAVADGLAGSISFNVGSGLQSDDSASSGVLLLASTAGLNQNGKVSIDLMKGAVVMGGTGTLADLGWINETLTKWGLSSPAILAISGNNTIDLSGSKLTVGSDGQNHFGDNSLTVVDVTSFTKDKPALKVDGAVASFGKDARLLLIGKLVDGNQHTILSSAEGYDGAKIEDTWSVVKNPSRLVNITTAFDSSGKDIIADVSMVSPTTAMPGLSDSLGGLMQAMARDPNFGFDPHSSNAGVRFLSRTAHEDYMPDGKAAAATAEGAAQLAAVGNVAGATLGASNSAALNTSTRMSFASNKVDASKSAALHQDVNGKLSVDSGLSAGDGLKNGLGLWLMPMYQHNTTWGLKSGNFKTGSSTDLFGISLGADYTVMESLRFGLAFNLGGGNSSSNGDFNTTDTRFNFWGLSLYGGWMQNNFGLSADVGYTRNFSAMEQDLPQSMDMAGLKADVNSDAWTAGLRGEYKFATSALDIIPHVGVRYTGIRSEDYKAKSAGETVFKVEESFQSLWTFPVGVTLSKEIDTASGWTFTPKVDLGIVAAAGDLGSKSRTRIPGLNTTAEMETQVVDSVSFDGGLGFEVKNDNVAFGLNYNIQASEHRTGHGLFGTVRYEF